MNRLKLVALLAVASMSFTANAVSYSDSDTREEVRIKGLYQGRGEVDRSIQYLVDAFYYPEINLIELNHVGIGDAEVYFVNSSNHIVDQFSVSGFNSVEYLPAPTTAGVYTLVIWSDTYYGEGVFTIN